MMNNVISTNTRPARRLYTAKEAAEAMAKIRAAAKEAEAAAAAAAEAVKTLDAAEAVIYWSIAEAAARAALKSAAKEAEAAAAIAAEAEKNETAKRFSPARAVKYAKEAEAAAAAARAAAKEAAENAAEAIRKPTVSEKRAAAEARIYAAINNGDKPAEVWAAIASEGYLLVKRDYFAAAIGAEAAKVYYSDITALCGKVTAALLTYNVKKSAEAENIAFDMLKAFIERVGIIEYAITADTVKILSDRAYTYHRTYGEGYTAAAIGGAGMMKEIFGHITAAETINAAAEAKAEAEARKEARRAAKAAKKAAAKK